MPIYEYRCLDCEKVVEVIQKINDRPLRKCRNCSGKLEKLISRTSFSLKGGGWFSEGYGGGSGGGSGERTSSGSSDSSTKSDSKKGDSKKSDSKKSDPSGSAKKAASA